MILYIETFQKLLENRAHQELSIHPSKHIPNHWRIIPKNKKRFNSKCFKMLLGLAKKQTILVWLGCCHIPAEQDLMEKGCIKITGL